MKSGKEICAEGENYLNSRIRSQDRCSCNGDHHISTDSQGAGGTSGDPGGSTIAYKQTLLSSKDHGSKNWV